MTISLIVTTYNRPDALRLVLDSISRQTRLPDEVVAVSYTHLTLPTTF